MRASPAISNFTGGEFSPLLEGRVDFPKYGDGCKKAENVVTLPQGPVTRRPGTRYIASTKNNGVARLVSFEFSNTQTYILEFGSRYIRFYMDGGQIESTPGTPYEVVTPYTAAQVDDLQFAQSADTLFITHVSHQPRSLTRTAHTSWTLATLTTTKGPFGNENTDTTLMLTPSGVTGAITLQASSAMFDEDHEGLLFKIRHSITKTIETVTKSVATGVVAQESQTATFTAVNQVSEVVGANTGWHVTYSLTGTGWTGTVKLQRSRDGATWRNLLSFTGNASTYFMSALEGPHYYRFLCSAYTGGSMAVTISSSGIAEHNAATRSISVAPGEYVQYVLSGTWTGTVKLQRTWTGNPVWEDYVSLTGNTDTTIQQTLSETVFFRFFVEYWGSGTISMSLVHTAQTAGEGIVRVDSVLTSTLATATVVSTDDDGHAVSLHSTDATSLWSEPAWSDYRGWPRCVTFFEDRLVFAGSPWLPQNIWMSKSSDYYNHDLGIDDDDAINVTLNSAQVNVICWIRGGMYLAVGTTGGEWRVGATDPNDPITPTSISAKEQTNYGSEFIAPVKAGNNLLWVQRAGRRIRELTSDFLGEGFVAKDLSILADHMTEGVVRGIVYQADPIGIVWMWTETGLLRSVTYVPEHEVVAWNKHTTDGYVESMATIAGDGETEVWLVVRRVIASVQKRFVERLASFQLHTFDQEDSYFVDCGLTYDGAAATTITGLDHLENETVTILADGGTHPDRVVLGNQITLNHAASVVHVGLPFTSTVIPMRPDFGRGDGTAQGKTKSYGRLTLRVYNTVGMKVGPSESSLYTVPWRRVTDPMGTPPALFTGDKFMNSLPSGFTTDGYIVVVQDQPLPLTLIGIYPTLDTTEM